MNQAAAGLHRTLQASQICTRGSPAPGLPKAERASALLLH